MRLSLAAAIAGALLVVAPASGFAQTPGARSFVTVQPPGQWLVSQFIGQAVTNDAGERIGDINDVLFDKSGRIENVVIGVGGFLGIGEKAVAIPFGGLSFVAGVDGKRVVKAALSKEQLQAAPEFKATEKTVYMRAKEEAIDKAGELKDKAMKKIDEMRQPGPTLPKSN